MRPVLCLVTDRRRLGKAWRDALIARVRVAAHEGVHLVQIREADLPTAVLKAVVSRCVEVCRNTRTRVIVNDRLDVALATGAHGVHLRADSMSAARVRGLCPRPFLIGRSVHSEEEARATSRADTDYVIFGTVFASESKPGQVAAGLGALRAVVTATQTPVLGIGGVTVARVAELQSVGAAGLAGIGLFIDDIATTLRQLRDVGPSSERVGRT